jgi:hypothetical protein
MPTRRQWATTVGRVFDTRPRVGNKDTVFLERRGAYETFARAMERSGSHVCLDGPTGVGKTSLVHTYIAHEGVRHAAVMVTESMSWPDFCRQLIGDRSNEEVAIEGGVEAGIQRGLPTIKFRVSLAERNRPIDDASLLEKLSNTWTEHDVAKRLADNDLLLFVDDLERSSPALMTRLSDLCKLLTQAYISRNAKIAMVGSGSIYVRLHKANPALDERVSQVSLGAFKYPSDSKIFITSGLHKLRLRHPWNSKLPKEFALRDNCRDAVWEAANGLPKSLNRLGYEIAMRGINRAGVTVNDIIECSHRMIEDHWAQYSQEFPDVLNIIEQDNAAAEFIRGMYSSGITRIHNVSSLIEHVCESKQNNVRFGLSDAERALDKLMETGFIVRTGKSGEKVFVRHPAAAHTLGVVMRNPDRITNMPTPKRLGGIPIQLQFAFEAPSNIADSDEPSHDA